MNWLDVLLTSLSMSIDAMTVNAANGLKEKGMKVSKMLFISAMFGLFQFGMPCIGYFVGYSFREALEKAIPWIAFGLLTILAIKSFIDWLKEIKQKDEGSVESKPLSIGGIFVQAVATSIDALCIGFVYLNYTIPNALLAFGIIGIVTFALSFLTVILAKQLAGKLEKIAGLLAAIVFLAIGIKILLQGIL